VAGFAAPVPVPFRAFPRVVVRAAAAAFVAVAARAVAARAVAVPAVAALRPAALAVAAVDTAAFVAAFVAAIVVAERAALARAASAPAPVVAATFAAAVADAVRRVRAAATGGSPAAGSTIVVSRCAFPGRGVGSCELFPVGVAAGRRAGRCADPVPGTGVDPSTRGLSWWSGLMHLTSVGEQYNALPGRGGGTHVNMP
jgi:hypothetical protein